MTESLIIALLAIIVIMLAVAAYCLRFRSASSGREISRLAKEFQTREQEARIRDEELRNRDEESRLRMQAQYREMTDAMLRQSREDLIGENRRQMEELTERHRQEVVALCERNRQELAAQTELNRRQLETQAERYHQELDALTERNRQLQEALTTQNNMKLEGLMAPMRERFEQFSQTINRCYAEDKAERRSLSDQLARLMDLNATIGNEARELTRALKGDSKVQGDWGEMVLATLLESAGLQKGINFFTQVTEDETGRKLVSDEGKGQRPDVVVLMPDDHRLIIDSKVSLTAYTRFCSATDDEARKREGQQHVRSVRSHIDELARAAYQKSVPKAAEHMLMFMPVEGAYFTAMQLDSELWKYAYDRKVVIVSPTHLFSVMQILSQLWRQEKQNRNAEQIARLGGLLYDRIAAFIGEFEKMEGQIDSVRKGWERSMAQLAEGNQSVVRRAERLRELGAKTSRRISNRALAETLDLEAPAEES